MESENEGIKIINIFLSKLSFTRNTDNVVVNSSETMDFDIKVRDEEKGDLLFIYLNVVAKSSKESEIQFKCEVEYTGHYQIIGEDKPHYYQDFIDISAPAMIYPYVREEIALITLKSIGRSLMLKPFNFISFANQVKEKKEKYSVSPKK